ncbi:MAG: alpha/beta fold hydrolase [Bacteroidota bacterium]
MKLNFRILGAGEPIIIMHGVFGSSDNWQTVGKSLSEKYKVYLVDLRNHGSSPHDDEMNYPVMAGDIVELIKNEDLDHAYVMGHSMGGKVAMELACSYPQLVKKLIVADIAPKYYPPHHQTILESFHTLPINQMTSRKEADDALSEKIANPGVRQFILKNLGRNDQDEFEWKLNYKAIENNIDLIGKGLEEGKTYGGDTLFINGSTSDYIQTNDKEIIIAHFPKAKIFTIDGAGHWVHAEKPKEITTAILEFLS